MKYLVLPNRASYSIFGDVWVIAILGLINCAPTCLVVLCLSHSAWSVTKRNTSIFFDGHKSRFVHVPSQHHVKSDSFVSQMTITCLAQLTGFTIPWLYPQKRGKTPIKNRRVLGMTLNCISPVNCGCRKQQRLHLCRGIRPPANDCPVYDIKQSNDEVPVMLALWGMQSTLSLPTNTDPFWPGVLGTYMVLSKSQIKKINI